MNNDPNENHSLCLKFDYFLGIILPDDYISDPGGLFHTANRLPQGMTCLLTHVRAITHQGLHSRVTLDLGISWNS